VLNKVATNGIPLQFKQHDSFRLDMAREMPGSLRFGKLNDRVSCL
jgi:hypothetical protein